MFLCGAHPDFASNPASSVDPAIALECLGGTRYAYTYMYIYVLTLYAPPCRVKDFWVWGVGSGGRWNQ